MTPTVAIAAGGTGGHVLPGLAIADALRRERPGAEVVFIGTEHGMEHQLVPEAGYRVLGTPARPFGTGARAITGPASLVRTVPAARAILRREGVEAVIGMGGYPSVPVILAARTMRIPAIVHEANAVAGLANQVAARVTPHIAVTFPATTASFGRRRPRVTGMPLRPEFTAFDRAALRDEALAMFDLSPDRVSVLAFGGSLGAASIVRAIIALAERWADRTDVQIVLAAGRDKVEDARGALSGSRIVRVEPYIERMDLAYAAADVVVGRAGSSSVAELAAVGVPSVLVPLPHARRGEQHQNARLLTDVGGAVLMRDEDLGTLPETLAGLVADPDRRSQMARAARSVARTDAAEQIASWALQLMEERDGDRPGR